jgi:hypothetical protein
MARPASPARPKRDDQTRVMRTPFALSVEASRARASS